MIRYQVGSHVAGDALVDVQNGLLGKAPARARPLDAVHVDHVRYALDPLQGVEDGGVVAKGQAQVAELRRMAYGNPVELRGSFPAGQVHGNQDALDAVPSVLDHRAGAGHLTVHNNPPAPAHKIKADVLRRRLKAAVVGRHTVRAQYAHGLSRHAAARSGTRAGRLSSSISSFVWRMLARPEAPNTIDSMCGWPQT